MSEREKLRSLIQESDLAILADALASGDPSGAIVRQEARGQASFAASDTLPTDMPAEARQMLERYGGELLAPVPGDPLFLFARLPAGWRKVPNEHPMWTDLLDDQGRRRAMIFYKAAFYDRRANLDLERRFGSRFDYERADAENVAVAVVTDCDRVIFATAPVQLPGGPEGFPVRARVRGEARAWLDAHYPDWANPLAYWDTD